VIFREFVVRASLNPEALTEIAEEVELGHSVERMLDRMVEAVSEEVQVKLLSASAFRGDSRDECKRAEVRAIQGRNEKIDGIKNGLCCVEGITERVYFCMPFFEDEFIQK